MKPEESFDFHIRWAWFRIARLYNTEANKFGSTMSVGYVLLNIDLEEGTPSTKLGPKMGMEPRSLTRTLKSMEERGLIYRKQDETDRRMVRIYLTDYGIEMRDVPKNAVFKLNEHVVSKISPRKLKSFFQIMEQINEVLQDNEIFETEKELK